MTTYKQEAEWVKGEWDANRSKRFRKIKSLENPTLTSSHSKNRTDGTDGMFCTKPGDQCGHPEVPEKIVSTPPISFLRLIYEEKGEGYVILIKNYLTYPYQLMSIVLVYIFYNCT